MKNEYKKIFDSVKPDEELLDKVLNKTDKKPFVPNKKIIAAALAFIFIIAGGGYGISNYGQRNSNDEIIIQKENESHIGGVLVAYASTNEIVDINEINISEMPAFYNITVIDYNSPKSVQEEKLKRYNSFYSEISDEIEREAEDGKGIFVRQGSSGGDDFNIKYCSVGSFILDINDYSNVENITVSNSSKYGEVVLSFQPDESTGIVFNHSNSVSATGAQLQASKDSGLFTKGIGEYEINTGYDICWQHSHELWNAIDENAGFDLSGIQDSIEFTVNFKDGTAAKSIIKLSFDKNGNMFLENGGYELIK